MRRSNFALHIPPTLFAEARKVAESEGLALNQLITVPNENVLWPGTNGFPDKHPTQFSIVDAALSERVGCLRTGADFATRFKTLACARK
jgi:hypothetical protein